MNMILSPKWWISMFVSTLFTIFFIVLIKSMAKKVSIPYVSDAIAQA